jgi:hypothetical protein
MNLEERMDVPMARMRVAEKVQDFSAKQVFSIISVSYFSYWSIISRKTRSPNQCLPTALHLLENPFLAF